jgi:hypothetical protein
MVMHERTQKYAVYKMHNVTIHGSAITVKGM